MRQSSSYPKMLFISLSGCLAWVAHFFISYALAEFGCIAGLGSVTLWIAGVSIVGIALGAFAVYKSVKLKHQIKNSTLEFNSYFIKLGVVNNSIFLTIIIFETIPLLFFQRRCL